MTYRRTTTSGGGIFFPIKLARSYVLENGPGADFLTLYGTRCDDRTVDPLADRKSVV